MKALIAVIKAVIGFVLDIVNPVRLVGTENIPAEGAFILCANHISFRDPVYMVLKLKRRIIFMGKAELYRNKILGTLLREIGSFPVERGKADMNAMRTAFKVLKDGDGLGIFPQGTRSSADEPTQMHSGTALIAQRSGAPVIPAYIHGPYRFFRRTKISFGKAVDLSEFARKTDAVTISQVTGKIEEAIFSMKD